MNDKSNKIVSAIVVTCGAGDHLRRCLDSVKSQTHPTFEIIVIDNSAGNRISEEINNLYSDIRLYPSPENLFYCAALNKGIAMSAGGLILCLNDDVVLEERFIEEAIKGFSAKERIGMVSGKILRADKSTIDSTGLFLSPFRSAKERGYGRKDKGQFERAGFVFGVNGAVAFYKREMLEDIKEGGDYFDPDFRMFYEDLDISWRAKRLNWKAYYVPGARAYHTRGASFRPAKGIGKQFARRYLSEELENDLIKNRYLCIIKNESVLGFILHLPAILLYDIAQWGYILLFRRKIIRIFFYDTSAIKKAFRKRYRGKSDICRK